VPRLFTAIEVPEAIASRLSLIRGNLYGARWVDKENYHMTLTFAGECDGRQMRAFCDALYEIEAEPFSLVVQGFGVFGGDRPRTLYAAIRPEPRLDALKRDHDLAARRAGIAIESRKYAPHVTLARLSGTSARMAADFLEHLGGVELLPFWVTRAVLMSSKPGGGGPYAIEESFDLGGVDYSEEADAWHERD
jgi:2'-5' RNA ligase